MHNHSDEHLGHGFSSKVEEGKYRKILWFCLWSNAIMFVIQIVASFISGSLSLLASSIDFISDSINYGISIYVIHSSIKIKARAAMLKGLIIFIMGLWVAAEVYRGRAATELPNTIVMGVISIGAISVNLICAMLLYGFRNKDSNTFSIWICSRNDVLENCVVLIAAILVYVFSSHLPDIVGALILTYLAISASIKIFGAVRRDMKKAKSEQ